MANNVDVEIYYITGSNINFSIFMQSDNHCDMVNFSISHVVSRIHLDTNSLTDLLVLAAFITTMVISIFLISLYHTGDLISVFLRYVNQQHVILL